MVSRSLRNYTHAPKSVGTKAHPSQVQNNTGGYVFQVSDKTRLERFLILGTDGGTYYVSESDLTSQNVDWLLNYIKRNPREVLDTVFDVSFSGRAYRNGPAIFVLALLLNHASDDVKSTAASVAPMVARTATMVYELASYLDSLGGWGPVKRRAVANWFTSKTPDQLAYQAVKYRQRDGWTLRDLMRLSHPVGVDQSVGNFILGTYAGKFSDYDPNMPGIIHGFTEMQNNGSLYEVLETLERYPSLPWETIPTRFHKEPEVWKTLFYNGQIRGQALVRNTVRLSRIGAFSDSVFRNDYASMMLDDDMIVKTRIHPMNYLLAHVVYNEGQINREHNSWRADRRKDWTADKVISDALEAGFYSAFKNVEPTGKRILVGVDVSLSMSHNSSVGSDLTSAQAAAAMAMVLARSESNTLIHGFSHQFVPLGITGTTNMSSAMRLVQDRNFGATDMSLPMTWAQQRRLPIDTFVIITDNEVNRGYHAHQTLKNYRNVMGINSRLVVMGTASTGFTIADPNDPGMLDVVGFDSNAPKVVSDFSAERF